MTHEKLNELQIIAHYTAELLCKDAHLIKATLVCPHVFECKMHVGSNVYRSIPMLGGEEFRLISSVVKGDKVLIRLAPKQRQEYAYAEVSLAHAENTFSFSRATDDYVHQMPCRDLLSSMFMQKDKVTGLTYDEIIKGAVRVETERHVKEQINSHDNFGTW